jgi:aldose 1-epimerase
LELFTMSSPSGVQAAVTNYGAIVQSIKTPDRSGKVVDIVLGFDTVEGYLGTHPYFGAVVGRYGNRVAKGRFTLDGKEYKLATNNGPNALHGGLRGFDKQVWQAREVAGSAEPAMEFTYLSEDGEEGYPGNLRATVRYTLTDKGELRIDYTATTDKKTVLNLTNHTYFNLAGQGTGDVLAHEVMIDADRFTPVDETLIPSGELRSVEGTPFDFRKPYKIGARIQQTSDEQIKRGNGYDHNFVLNGTPGTLRRAARVVEPSSGRVLEVSTTQPGMQFYTGNFLDGSVRGKGGRQYGFRSGFCMETQHFPDSPNHPNFPTTTLNPGETYRTTTVFRFTTNKG